MYTNAYACTHICACTHTHIHVCSKTHILDLRLTLASPNLAYLFEEEQNSLLVEEGGGGFCLLFSPMVTLPLLDA